MYNLKKKFVYFFYDSTSGIHKVRTSIRERDSQFASFLYTKSRTKPKLWEGFKRRPCFVDSPLVSLLFSIRIICVSNFCFA